MLSADQHLALNAAPPDALLQKQLLADLLSEPSVVYRASLAQQRLWFLYQLQSESAAYNVHLGMWLRGPLDIDALRASLQEMVNRHESLRTFFRLESNELRQIVAPNLILKVPVDDLTKLSDPTAEAYRLATREVETPFQLREAPLFRARIFRVTGNDHVLLCTMHHIVTDSWSVQILARELEVVYAAFSAGRPSPLRNLPFTYGDYSEWQHQWFETRQVQQQLNYWKERLANAPPVLELPKDAARPAEQSFAGASDTMQLSNEIVDGLKLLAMRRQATPFIVLLTAFKVLLLRYSGQTDLLVGVPVAGRNRIEAENLIGFFVNTLVLRNDLSGNPRFSDLLAQVRDTTLGAFANADVPFEKVVEALKPERNLSYNPIFQVMFSVIKAAVQSNTFGNLTAFPYIVDPSTSIFDLSTTLIERGDGRWWAQIDYNADMFEAKRIREMLQDYIELLQSIVADPETRILQIPMANVSSRAVSQASPLTLVGKTSSPVLTTTSTTRTDRELSSPGENLLLGIWKRLLGLENVSIRDHFFDVGGHSLLAAKLIAEVQDATGRKLPVSAVFRAPTIESFAKLLKGESLDEPDPTLMKLNQGAEGQLPLFAIAIPGVDTFGFGLLAHHISPVHPVYKIQAAAPVVTGRPFTKEEKRDLAKEYIAAMRSVQPRGPYCMAAMCDGVLIAQEAILQLESAGEEVGFFAIFDTWVLENSQVPWRWAVDYYLQRFRTLWSVSPNEKLAMVRRVLGRQIYPRNGGNNNGWRHAYWPGDDYQPPRFRAPVLLFKRPRQPFYYVRDSQMGWGQRSLGGVEICEIDCGHVEMLREPYVRFTGQVIGTRLRILSQRAGSQPLAVASSQKIQPSPSDDGAWLRSAA